MKKVQIKRTSGLTGKCKDFQVKKILLGAMVALLASCSSGGVYNNLACGVHPTSSCAKKFLKEERINLSADALFHFDRYREEDLLDEGRVQLDELASKLVNGYVYVENITLIGHTDRMGSVPYNDRLGLNRAKTVRAYLQSHGVDANIAVETRGESEPVTDGCFNIKGPRETARGLSRSRVSERLRACLQPDRRVVVKVLGIKKVTQCASSTVNNDVINN